MSKHTPGPWIVVERKHPYKDGSKAHIERNIYTEWQHPQLKDNYPVVCTSVGIGMDGEKAIHFAHINAEDARLIAVSPSLLAALIGCVEHMEHSTPQGKQAYETAKTEIAKATGETQ